MDKRGTPVFLMLRPFVQLCVKNAELPSGFGFVYRAVIDVSLVLDGGWGWGPACPLFARLCPSSHLSFSRFGPTCDHEYP